MTKTQLQEKLLQETKYSKWYLNIIKNAQSQNRAKLKKIDEDYVYYENHHILPQAKGLFDEYKDLELYPWNGVLLTAKEHFICHMSLAKHYKSIEYIVGERKMSKAFVRMSNGNKYTSKDYSYFKLNLSCSEETKKKMSEAGKTKVFSESHKKKLSEVRKGKNLSEETKKKMSLSKKGKKSSEETKRKISIALKGIKRSEETKKKMSIFQKGKIVSSDTKKKMSEAHKGKKHTHSEETKRKIGESNKGKKRSEETKKKMRDFKRKTVICPHCNKEGGISVMKRWHFDNCKLNKLNK